MVWREHDLSQRRRVPELMDQPELCEAEHHCALRGLRRINRLSRGAAIFWPSLRKLARESPIRVLDLATGGGDVAITLAKWSSRAGLRIAVEGCDISSRAIEFARERARVERANVQFFTRDALAEALPDDYDVLCCSLFLHHLDDESALLLLRRMAEAARRLVLVNDLIRSASGLLLARIGCRLLSRSRVVHYDGPVSVQAAYQPREVLELADKAGLRGASLTRHWPQRFLLSWSPE